MNCVICTCKHTHTQSYFRSFLSCMHKKYSFKTFHKLSSLNLVNPLMHAATAAVYGTYGPMHEKVYIVQSIMQCTTNTQT